MLWAQRSWIETNFLTKVVLVLVSAHDRSGGWGQRPSARSFPGVHGSDWGWVWQEVCSVLGANQRTFSLSYRDTGSITNTEDQWWKKYHNSKIHHYKLKSFVRLTYLSILKSTLHRNIPKQAKQIGSSRIGIEYDEVLQYCIIWRTQNNNQTTRMLP